MPADKPLLSEREIERLWHRSYPIDDVMAHADEMRFAHLVAAAVLRKAARMVYDGYGVDRLREMAAASARAARGKP